MIEAAETLPTWVKPTNSENRVRSRRLFVGRTSHLFSNLAQVWIYSSRLHLIPISHVSPPSRKRRRRRLPGAKESDDEGDGNIEDDDDDFIVVEDALKLVRDASVHTMAPPNVEKTVWQRISG